MPETYINSSLRAQGYTGATGNTPYKPATPQQLEALRQVYDNPAIAATRQVVSSGAVVLNVNFDGTHHNTSEPDNGVMHLPTWGGGEIAVAINAPDFAQHVLQLHLDAAANDSVWRRLA